MKNKILSFIMALIVIMTVTSCKKVEDIKINYDLTSEPVTFDPQTAKDEQSMTVINNVFEGLLKVDENGDIVNGAAESYTVSDDGLTYTFYLKDGLMWSNGYYLTAKDFEFAFRRLFDPKTKSASASSFYCIKNSYQIAEGLMDSSEVGVKADGDNKLIIQLEYKNSLFTQLLTTCAAMPCNEKYFYETEGEYGLDADKIICNGAFYVDYWKPGQYLKLVKNDSYYDESDVKVGSVVLWVCYSDNTEDEENELLDRFLSSETDAYNFVGVPDDSVFNSKSITLIETNDTVWGLEFNLKNTPENTNFALLNNLNFRRAIASCFDRVKYEDVLPEFLSVTKSILPQSISIGQKSYAELNDEDNSVVYDEQSAKGYLQSAQGELNISQIPNLTVTIPYDDSVDNEQYFSYISQLIQKDLNIFLTIDNDIDPEDYEEILSSSSFDIVIRKHTAAYNSPLAVLNDFTSQSENNLIGFSNAQYDNYVSNILLTDDDNTKLINTKNAEKLLLEQAVFIPLYSQSDYLALNKSATGIMKNSQNGLVSFRYAEKS